MEKFVVEARTGETINQHPTFNGMTRPEIFFAKGPEDFLYYHVACKPRILRENEEESGSEIDEELFEKLKETMTCHICTNIMLKPKKIWTCMHGFCDRCMVRHFDGGKKECMICRKPVGNKRYMRHDVKLNQIIEKFFESPENFNKFEEERLEKNVNKAYNFDERKKHF